jgi:hypothetical protein
VVYARNGYDVRAAGNVLSSKGNGKSEKRRKGKLGRLLRAFEIVGSRRK